MKWLTFLLTASTAVSSAPIGDTTLKETAITEQVRAVATVTGSVDILTSFKNRQLTFLEKQVAHEKKLVSNRAKMQKVLTKLKKTAGKTWYVFSGATPSGWDCSGLVRWTYEQLSIELEHRADAQADSGKKVKTPIPGDIVAFYRKGSDYSFHVGIYLGKGKMIHAYRHGMRTVIQPVKQVVKENWGARVTYTRILPQPEN